MPNPQIKPTLRLVKTSEVLELECGRCHRTALVTLLQLARRNIDLDTTLDVLAHRSFCQRCGHGHPGNKVRIRDARG
jgi:ribosomal protein S27AE